MQVIQRGHQIESHGRSRPVTLMQLTFARQSASAIFHILHLSATLYMHGDTMRPQNRRVKPSPREILKVYQQLNSVGVEEFQGLHLRHGHIKLDDYLHRAWLMIADFLAEAQLRWKYDLDSPKPVLEKVRAIMQVVCTEVEPFPDVWSNRRQRDIPFPFATFALMASLPAGQLDMGMVKIIPDLKSFLRMPEDSFGSPGRRWALYPDAAILRLLVQREFPVEWDDFLRHARFAPLILDTYNAYRRLIEAAHRSDWETAAREIRLAEEYFPQRKDLADDEYGTESWDGSNIEDRVDLRLAVIIRLCIPSTELLRIDSIHFWRW